MKVVITKINESYLKIDCEKDVAHNIGSYFTFYADNHRFHPKVKAGIWDGKIRLFNLRDKTFPIGLYNKLIDFCESYDYEIVTTNAIFEPNNITQDDIQTLCKDLKITDIQPRDYQIQMVCTAINENKIVGISPTSSGKSFIIFMFANLIRLMHEKSHVLIVVPSLSLVSQMQFDFLDYGKNVFGYDRMIEVSTEGLSSKPKRPFVITTWQMLSVMSREDAQIFNDYLAHFKGVVVDECHGASAKEIQNLVTCCLNATYKMGMTGTMHESKVSNTQINGLFGDKYQFTTTQEMIAEGYAPPLEIKGVILNYTDVDKKAYSEILQKMSNRPQKMDGKERYNFEMDYLRTHKERFRFVVKLVNKITKSNENTLVLFRDIKGEYGKKIYKALKEHFGRDVVYIDGSVKGTEREMERRATEQAEGKIIVASLGVFSTGISIKRLHNLVIAEPIKSKVKVIQSLGRTLRVHETKDVAVVYDIGDNLDYGKWKGYSLKHFMSRIDAYDSEGHPYSAVEYNLK